MDAIQKAISDVKFKIPRAILEKAFINRISNFGAINQFNIDSQILDLVVKPRVLTDCNILGGTQVLISIGDLPYDRPDNSTTVVRIPKNRTQGKSIITALHVSFLSPTQVGAWGSMMGVGTGVGGGNYADNSALMTEASAVMAAVDKIPVTSSARVTLIAENTIAVKDVMNLPLNSFLRCIVSNDDNMNNLQIKSHLAFSKLVELAVKSYIYNTLLIDIDMAELQGGYNLGVFKTVIEGYSEAEQNYQDYLKDQWHAIAFMNDGETYRRYVKMMIANR